MGTTFAEFGGVVVEFGGVTVFVLIPASFSGELFRCG
jgi:hypothetical protein